MKVSYIHVLICILLYFFTRCSSVNNPRQDKTLWKTGVYSKDTFIANQKVACYEYLYYNSTLIIENYFNNKDSLLYGICHDIYNDQNFEGITDTAYRQWVVDKWVDIDTISKTINLTFWRDFRKGDTICFSVMNGDSIREGFCFYNNPAYKTTFKYNEFYFSDTQQSIILNYPVKVQFKFKDGTSRTQITNIDLGNLEYQGVSHLRKYIKHKQ